MFCDLSMHSTWKYHVDLVSPTSCLKKMCQKLQEIRNFNTFHRLGTCILTLFYIFNILLDFQYK